MRSWRERRRPRVTVPPSRIAFIVGLTACGAGGGEAPSSLPSTRTTQRSASGEPRTATPERTTEAAETTRASTVVTPERTRTTESTGPARNTTGPPTVTEPTPTRTTQTTGPARTTQATASARVTAPVEQTPTPAASAPAVAVTGTTGGLGLFGWLLVLALVAALIVAWVLVARSQRRSGWDTEARVLGSETRGITATRLPPALRATTTSRRALVWPPVRADLIDMQNRWRALAERASGDVRRNWSLQVTALLYELIAAVDMESEALGTGQDWTLFRVRVDEAGRTLASVLGGQPPSEPPPAAEPGTSAFQT